MIKFGKPYIELTGNSAVLKNSVEIDGNSDVIWFKVNKKFKDYLCFERGDAYLIASLNYAMRNHHDIEFEIPITGSLLFNIQNYLIPALIENNPSFYSPRIIAKVDDAALVNYGAVGTGISCGVDSLHAVATKSKTCSDKLNVTYLAFNNVGSHGCGKEGHELYEARIEKARGFAEELGYEFVLSDSNLMDVLQQSHFKSHTYSSMFPVYCLQKLYSIYYYSSAGYKFNEFNLKDLPTLCPGSYELLSLDVFSTPSLRVYSEGMGKSRLQKLSEVVKYEPSYKYLNVCLNTGDNCGKCEKCVRTLLGLDVLGALDHYAPVFDIEYYTANRKWYLQQMLYQMARKKHDYFEMYPYLKHDVTISMRLKASIVRLKYNLSVLLKKNKGIERMVRKMLRK